MATYKVLQDIEAEDKLIGPLTLRQCIYAAVAVIAGYLSFLAVTKGAAFMVVFFLPFIAFGLFFAFPWTKEQSTEVWALAKVRFALKPRKRIWDQSGVKELVSVTVPKQIEDPRAHRLSENEVRSRLHALATTIDSRGWAVKNVPLNMYVSPTVAPQSDRLVQGSDMPQEVPSYSTTSGDDMFDLDNNPIAQQFEAKIAASTTARRQQIMIQIADPQDAAAAPLQNQTDWYGAAPAGPQAFVSVPQAANPTAEEMAMAAEFKRRQELMQGQSSTSGHMRVIQPLSDQPDQPVQAQTPASPQYSAPAYAQQTPQLVASQPMTQVVPAAPLQAAQQVQNANPNPAVTPPVSPAILELANNNDLDIATIAREAQHRAPEHPDEVVVSLH
jgi:hypothetical protein